jgi:UDP-N-acetylglucosamine diphosphorylase/glucosamine-1-phosphate N-acetyltransferase
MIFVYEDEGYRNLEPLVTFRPVFDLRCGRETLLERVCRLNPSEEIGLLVRPELAALTRELHPSLAVNPRASGSTAEGMITFLSARVVLRQPIPTGLREAMLVHDGEIVGFRAKLRHATKPPLKQNDISALKLSGQETDVPLVRYPWDIVALNEIELDRDLPVRRDRTRLPAGVHILGKRQRLFVSRGALVDPGVVLDVRSGAVYLDRNSQVRAGSVVTGPCYVGPGTVLDHALVRPGSSFGPECRIGGEVESSVFIGHSNKHHEGFIGHAVIGEWVNLGALTTNSDLRNDYGEVHVRLRGRELSTELRKFGCIIGDHAKTAIGSLLNTGGVVGVFANWFEPGLAPKDIPAFAWGSRGRCRLSDALETARTVMSRRGVTMSRAYEQLVRRSYARIGR